ncbi:PDZ domain-containing protein [Streptomyces sp. NPDC059740]|uniref:YlbL family protein n=1 Tax=Streptomyces sp. NPDC059740 TaxID=3346926 RepID=UPI00366A3652
MSSRSRALTVCAVLVVALLAVAVFAPLPFSIAAPGETADVLGSKDGKPVITVSGATTRPTTGQLRMTTIAASGPDVAVHLPDVVSGWFDQKIAVMPHDAVYPAGDSDQEVNRRNLAQMRQSQNSATAAALGYLHRSGDGVKVTLRLAGVGGPSAGLMFSLGIIDRLAGDGAGHDLTGGRTIAGTGTITDSGKVGPVGGVALKTQGAARAGATVFLVPREECTDARAHQPKGMRLVPVTSLSGAVDSLRKLRTGAAVPSC